MYYTFRRSRPDTVEVTKWDPDRSMPLDTYLVELTNRPLNARMCSCPARVPCVHLKALREAQQKIDELWKWNWSREDGWYSVEDLSQPFEYEHHL